jgi:hypothetical protein
LKAHTNLKLNNYFNRHKIFLLILRASGRSTRAVMSSCIGGRSFTVLAVEIFGYPLASFMPQKGQMKEENGGGKGKEKIGGGFAKSP